MKMLYLSKGVVQPESGTGSLLLERGGKQFRLQGMEAAVWLRGRFGFKVTESETEEQAVLHLTEKGLAEAEGETGPVSRYRILTRCVCCPAKREGDRSSRLDRQERQVYTWLQKAGIRLSVAELVFLMEHRVTAEGGMLGIRNRQKLVEAIYTKDNIQDNLLEHQMEKAGCRDEAVGVLMSLLEKKKILIL